MEVVKIKHPVYNWKVHLISIFFHYFILHQMVIEYAPFFTNKNYKY